MNTDNKVTTPLQDLLSFIDNWCDGSIPDVAAIENKAKELLKREQSEIEQAYSFGRSDGWDDRDEKNTSKPTHVNALSYFKNTFADANN
jgi:hypothetical protein